MRNMVICLLAVATSTGRAQSPHGEWTAFLRAPGGESYRQIANALDGCHSPACAQEVAPDSESLAQLGELVQKSNRWAIALAFRCHRFLDGGALEDLSRSLGALADTNPRLFLKEAAKHRLTPGQLKIILQMMPESAIDDVDRREAAVETRIQALSSVKDKELRRIRDDSVALLRSLLRRAEPGQPGAPQ